MGFIHFREEQAILASELGGEAVSLVRNGPHVPRTPILSDEAGELSGREAADLEKVATQEPLLLSGPKQVGVAPQRLFNPGVRLLPRVASERERDAGVEECLQFHTTHRASVFQHEDHTSRIRPPRWVRYPDFFSHARLA